MLAGPGEGIIETVMDDLGAGLSLPAAGVDVRDRVAHVYLEGPVAISQKDRQLLAWQVQETLIQVPAIQSVEVAINSVSVDASTLPVGPNYELDRFVAVVDGGIVVWDSNATIQLLGAQEMEGGAAFPAIGPVADSPLAWLDSEGSHVSILRAREQVSVAVAQPSKPSIDRFGNVWVVDQAESTLVRIDSDDHVSTVANPLGAPALSGVFVAPDGARMILLGQGEDGGALWMAALVPQEDGGFQVSSVQALDRVKGDVLDVTWSGSTGLSALVASPDAEETVIRSAPVGGWTSRYLAPVGVTAVTAGADPRNLIVQRPDQTAFQRSGAAWRDLGNAREYLSAPG